MNELIRALLFIHGCFSLAKMTNCDLLLLSPRHSPLEKSHSSHFDCSIFKQPPPLEPPMSSPPASLRDPPWPHGGTPPGRSSPSDRHPTVRKDSTQTSAATRHRIPRPYNKVASSEYKFRRAGNRKSRCQ